MPSESTEELIFQNIESELKEITAGTTYWYTPKVVRADQFSREVLEGHSSKVIYVIRDTSESAIVPPERSFGKNAKLLTAFVLLAFKDERASDDPYSMKAPVKGTIRHRMIRDVEIKLNEDGTRGGNAEWTLMDTITKDFDEGVGPWVIAEVAANVQYQHSYDAP